jgi:transcriptional regulator with XRE-family HTH domain
MLIGRRIREIREKMGITQSELAEKSGLTPAAISQIESGKRARPTDDTIHKIAKALNTTYELLTLTNREDDKISVTRNFDHRRRPEGNITIKIDNINCAVGVTALPPEKEERNDDFDVMTFISTRRMFENALENAITEVMFENKEEIMKKFYANLDNVRNNMVARLDFVSKIMDGVASNDYEVEVKKNSEGEDS